MKLFATCAQALASRSIDEKLGLVDAIARAYHSGTIELDIATGVEPIDQPGYPDRLRLVPPRDVPKRSTATAEGRVALIHAIAHIEFNAIHLALDACYRFRGLPDRYYADWAHVAAEEAQHFSLLARYLTDRGFRYGDFTAHNGLWEMAQSTAADGLARMALVPRVMEARGLDVTPGILDRFARAGDAAATAILEVILRDEIGHVAIGNHWYRYLCAAQSLDPEQTFVALARQHRAPRPHLPLNRVARLQAGFTEHELEVMLALEKRD